MSLYVYFTSAMTLSRSNIELPSVKYFWYCLYRKFSIQCPSLNLQYKKTRDTRLNIRACRLTLINSCLLISYSYYSFIRCFAPLLYLIVLCKNIERNVTHKRRTFVNDSYNRVGREAEALVRCNAAWSIPRRECGRG